MKKKINVEKGKVLKFLGIMISTLTLVVGISFAYNYSQDKLALVESDTNVNIIEYNSARVSERSADFKEVYLSDITPLEKHMGYRDLMYDADLNGNPLVLKVEDNWFSFKKGLFAHAKANIIYDLTDYDEYNYFVAFVGINKTSNKGNGVTYHFYTSDDKSNWTEVGEGINKAPSTNATYVEIPLNNAKYLKLEVHDNGGNGNDHSVFADAKLVSELNGNFVLESVEELDEEIESKYNGQTNVDEDLAHLILKRELVKRVGKYTINSYYNENEDNRAALDWLLSDKTVLRYYVLGGTPDGSSYYNSLTQLARLYKEYKDDFKITETTKYGTVLGDLYLRMAIALSLTHSQTVGLWMQASVKENQSDAIVRYQIYKDLHKNNKFRVTDTIDITKWFENYNVENMRFVMNNLIDDESILWLNEYVQSKIDANPGSAWSLLTPHSYIAYVWPNYANSVYYDDANYDYFNELFSVNGKKLYDYNITRGTEDKKIYKVWMNFRNKFGTGCVCGGISKSGSNIRATHGIAATVIGQPGHAALLYYSEDNQGRGYWNIDNDVSGWTLSEKGERMLLGWGNASYSRGYSVVYMALAQEVLNDYDNFEKAEELIMLARSYNDDLVKQEELLRKALAIQPINIDAWYDLIQVYEKNSNKTENDYFNLAEELAENLKYFPLPMYHLTNLIKPKMVSVENLYRFSLLQTRILNLGKNTPNNTADNYTVYQPSLTRLEANYLLGQVDNSIASFSFDGVDAGKIVLSSRFDGSGVRWDYSLDGKNTWNEVAFTAEEEHKLQLTAEQINSITEGNDIYVHIVGVNYDEKNLYKIDITKGTLLSEIFANDLENRVVGVNLNTEWRYKESDAWTSYGSSSPNLTGDKTVQIRQAATGTTLASDPSEMFTFTEDNQPDTRKYIPVSHLTIHSVSTEAVNQGGAAVKAIDGNYNTRYHSAWNGTDQQRFIVIKLDKAVSLSAVEFVPAGGGNGKIYDGTVYGSMDGENWEELSSLKNLTYTNQANTVADAITNTKNFEIADAKEVQYVKIVADRSNANWFAARAFNLYQDISKNPHPTAGVAYSTTEATNGKVIARLVNPSTKITITNNGGSDTYVFSENGEFTFEFVDENGITGSAVAKVDWIDKDIPSADVDYELDNNHKISISLDGISEDVYLLDKNNNPINFIEVKDKKVTSVSYLDSSKNVYKTVEVDENGNITKIIYKNTSNKVSSVANYVTIMANGVITGEEYYDDHGNSVTVSAEDKEVLKGLQQPITDPLEHTFEQSGDYEFKLLDKANNIAYKSIKVDYDDDNTIVASDISYDITHLTNKNVTASIKPYVFNSKGEKEEAEVVSGNNVHVFEDNGNFEFQYKAKDDDHDDVKKHTAVVTWIDKTAPTAEIKYTALDNGNVVATLTNESEEIIIINNGTNRDYIFTQNGEFTFKFEDMAGNQGYATAKVDSMSGDVVIPNPDPLPSEPENPSTPNEPDDTWNPSEPETPVNPSVPSKPVNPNKPYRPSKPNTGSNTNNQLGNAPTISEPIDPIDPDEEESIESSDENSIKKPENDIKKPVIEDKTEEDKTNRNIMIYLVLLFVGAILITGIIYIRNKRKN